MKYSRNTWFSFFFLLEMLSDPWLTCVAHLVIATALEKRSYVIIQAMCFSSMCLLTNNSMVNSHWHGWGCVLWSNMTLRFINFFILIARLCLFPIRFMSEKILNHRHTFFRKIIYLQWIKFFTSFTRLKDNNITHQVLGITFFTGYLDWWSEVGSR